MYWRRSTRFSSQTSFCEELYFFALTAGEQDFEGGVLNQSRVHLLGARGIEAVVAIDHMRGNQATLRWLLYDGHGNVVQVMFPHPLPLSRSFGRGVSRRRRGEGSCANLGHPEDETGLVYMRARYYEPWTGRFISEDPGRNGVNWYLYADGSPVGKVDFEGKQTDDDSFDPVYWFNWREWWLLYACAWEMEAHAGFSLLAAALAAATGDAPRAIHFLLKAVGYHALSAVLTIALYHSITLLWSLRFWAWYAELFPEEFV